MITVGIVGATGYTGAELYRLALRHPDLRITFATSEQYHGKHLSEVFPQIDPRRDILLRPADSVLDEPVDVVCLCTPDGVAMRLAPHFLNRGARVIDVSPDFRFETPEGYKAWYKQDHQAPALLHAAVYGLPELNRRRIREARLVGNPGCYPTSVILGLAPLLAEGLIDPEHIIVDAKSGVSGAGRGLKLRTLYVEVNDSIAPYGIGHKHRHVGEMEQELGKIARTKTFVVFSPHLTPMSRGILSTMYVRLTADRSTDDLMSLYERRYQGEPFIRMLRQCLPETRFVAGSNFCDLAVERVSGTDQAIVASAIDNLVKGAAGQAIQNLNVMCGLDETAGLLS